MNLTRTLVLSVSACGLVGALAACSSPSSGGDDIRPAGGASSGASAASSSSKPSDTHTVVYEVTSDAATAMDVTYFTISGTGSSGQEQTQDAPMPFSKSFDVKGSTFFDGAYSLVAQAADGATMISCKITVDGKEKANQTSTGQFAVVTCSGTGT